MKLTDDLIDSFIIKPEGLPIIDADEVETWIASGIYRRKKAQVWRSIGDYWIETLAESLGDAYWLLESKHFCILTMEADDVAQQFGGFCEEAYRAVLKQMEAVSKPHPYGCYYVLLFEDVDRYYQYISPLLPERRDLSQSSGVFISSGYPHFALPSGELFHMEAVMSHELAHAAVSHLDLPVWLNEGLAQTMEELLTGQCGCFRISAERAEQHRSFWNAARIKTFWSGDAFRVAGESCQLSYDLARIMIELMSSDKKRFLNFVKNIGSGGHGAKAARDYLGRDLDEILFGFLGPVIHQKAG